MDPPPKDEIMNEPGDRYVGKRSTRIILLNNQKKNEHQLQNFPSRTTNFQTSLETAYILTDSN